jgi:hypothetical protein
MHGRVFQAAPLAALLMAAGCQESGPGPEKPPAELPARVTSFDPTTAGSVSGTVVWQGDVPKVPSLPMRTDPPVAPGETCPHPNQPQIDPETRGVGNAVVFLRGVDASKSRPWDHSPVLLEMRGLALHVCQSGTDSRLGFVRQGEAIDMVSRDVYFHALEARGAECFSLRFVERDRASKRTLRQPGIVELSSAAGYYWMRAYLFVVDHPYYTRTDARGRFHLPRVPPGAYELVCWLPSWTTERQERDAESGLVTRMILGKPLEQAHRIEVGPKTAIARELLLSAAADR